MLDSPYNENTFLYIQDISGAISLKGTKILSFFLCLSTPPVFNILYKLPLISLGYLHRGDGSLDWQAWRGCLCMWRRSRNCISAVLSLIFILITYLSCERKCIPHLCIIAPENIRLLCFWSCFMSQNAVLIISWLYLTTAVGRTHSWQEEGGKYVSVNEHNELNPQSFARLH